MKKLNVLLMFFCSLLFLIFPSVKIQAEEYYFQEEFNQERISNTLASNKWTVYPNDTANITTIKETGGNLITSQTINTHQYPLIISKNALPDGDFSMEIKFQYTKVTNWGTGFALSEGAVINGSSFNEFLNFQFWQDISNGPYMRLTYNDHIVYASPAPNTSVHVLKIDRIGTKYFVYFDSVLVFTSPDTPIQTKYIWLGNPTHQNSLSPGWTSFNVDYIHVKQLPPPKTPVVFIPGIGGSEFKSNQIFTSDIKECGINTPFIYGNNDTVWVNKTIAGISLCDDYFDVLKLQSDGLTPTYPQIILNGEIFQDSYSDAINFFKENGYELNKTLFVFPYDWRKDIALTAPLLDQKINEIKQQTGAQKVDIVAHSMGGLVAKNYIKDSAQAGKVRKLVTLGTPYLGSVKLLKTLRYGDYFGPTFFMGLISISPNETKDIIQNYTGAFELLPSKSYYEFYDGTDSDHLTPFRDDNDIDKNGVKGSLNYVQLQQLLAYFNHNMNLSNSADNFHTQLDKIWQNGTNNVDTTLVVGSGEPTLIQINEQNKIKFQFGFDSGVQINKREEILGNGDGTVPLYSASLIDNTRNLNLGGSSKVYFTNQGHGNLVNKNSGPALQLALNILENKTDIPTGVQTSPYKLTGKEILVQSPVELHIYDSQSRHTGSTINGDFENNIPGSIYSTLGTTKSIWLPENGQYTFKLLATDNGDFDLKIRSFENDVNTQTIIYKDVPILNTTKIEADYNTSSTSPILEIDQDGNGTVDKQIESSAVLTGNQNNDQTSPTTTINLNGQKGNNNWYINDVAVELLANDQDSGSGILKTVYTLDGGQTTKEYSSPFVISFEGINKLQVKSIDKAGNEEFPVKTAEIKIDKTNPVVNISADPINIWPANKKMVDVKISGNSSDNTSGISFKQFTFEDEYKTLNPTIADFDQTVKLEAWRDGNDKDGRIYTVKVSVEDQAGNKSEANTNITVPHDQR